MYLNALFFIKTETMIQRIQSVFLLIVTALLAIASFKPFGYFLSQDNLSQVPFTPFGINIGEGQVEHTWGLLALLVLGTIISFATIFLFKNRMLQIRMCIFNILVLVGYYSSMIVFLFYSLAEGMIDRFHISWAISLPVVSIILLILAIRGIGADEALVKATNRLR